MNAFNLLISKPQLRSLLLGFSFLLVAQGAQASLNICLYARANNHPISGHAFVTVEDENSKVLESYGFWPKKMVPQSLVTNYRFDHPARMIEKFGGHEHVLKALPESRICQNIEGATLPEIRQLVSTYRNHFGEYNYVTNNCTIFAIRIYNEVSGDSIPMSPSPSFLKGSIKKVYVSKVRSFNEYRNR